MFSEQGQGKNKQMFIQRNTIQCNAVQYSTIQSNTNTLLMELNAEKRFGWISLQNCKYSLASEASLIDRESA